MHEGGNDLELTVGEEQCLGEVTTWRLLGLHEQCARQTGVQR